MNASWLALLLIGAGPYDPGVPFYTLTTPHFLVSYAKGYEHIALRAARIAEDTYPYLVERYDWEPDGRTSIIIDDQTDFANGSATIFPNKVITIYVTAPTRVSGLEDMDDWLTTVVQHEMAHIWHLDMSYGLPWIGRFIFGKYAAMNQYTPAWITEGLAVYEETVASGAGRGRSRYVDMVIRSAALEDRFPGIDQGYRGHPDWPFSNIAYFFGGRFQLWLAEHYGEKALLDYHRSYATNPFPYLIFAHSLLELDEPMESLWLAFEEEMKAEAERIQTLVKSSTIGETIPERLTFEGGESVGPRVTPDGKHVIFSSSSPIDGPRVRRLDLATMEDEALVNDTLSESISFTPDGRAFYFQQAEINQRFYQHNSIFRYDVAKESFARVELDPNEPVGFRAPSGSLRVRDPDLSPDGKRLVFVQTPYGSNRIVLAWIESNGTTIHPKVIVPASPDVIFANPRFSPDGDLIAVGRFRGGRRDVILYDLDGRLVRELTRDREQDTDPTWSPDGKWIVFSSDRSGIYNLYAHHLETGTTRQLTNLITGAFQPCISPDGKTIVYRGYSADGFDIYRLPFAPDAGIPVEIELSPEVAFDRFERSWPPRDPRSPEIPPPAPFADTPLPDTLPEGWTIDDYSPLSTLLPFQDNWNLYPSGGFNEVEAYGSLTHVGADARGTHFYSLSATYGTLTKFFGGGAAYVNDVLEPTFSIVGVASANSFYRAFEQPNLDVACPRGPDEDFLLDDGRRLCGFYYNERRLTGQFSIGLPVLQRHLFSLSYRFENRAALQDPPEFLNQPPTGNFARVSLGYAYANFRFFPYSISPERGPSFGIALSAYSRGLGSDYEQFQVTASGRYYLGIPWPWRFMKNHVLAAQLSIGFGAGPDNVDLYTLGGVESQSLISTTTENFHGLRGLRQAALAGTGVIAGSLEYRAPIIRVDRGLGTVPVVLRVVHLALFSDFGRVFGDVNLALFKDDFFDPFTISVGAELRADLILAFALPLTLRFGVAYPVVRPMLTDIDLKAQLPIYFQLGSQF